MSIPKVHTHPTSLNKSLNWSRRESAAYRRLKLNSTTLPRPTMRPYEPPVTRRKWHIKAATKTRAVPSRTRERGGQNFYTSTPLSVLQCSPMWLKCFCHHWSANDDHTKDRIDPIPDLFLQRITISISIRSDPHSKYQRHPTIQCYK